MTSQFPSQCNFFAVFIFAEVGLSAKITKICTQQKFPAIRYVVLYVLINSLNVTGVYIHLMFTSREHEWRIYTPVLYSGPYHTKKRSLAALQFLFSGRKGRCYFMIDRDLAKGCQTRSLFSNEGTNGRQLSLKTKVPQIEKFSPLTIFCHLLRQRKSNT